MMTNVPKHGGLWVSKYIHRSDDVRRYEALRREFEPKSISPYGLEYFRKDCANNWDRWFSEDPPFNYQYSVRGPEGDWNPISLEQQIELCEEYFLSRRRLKRASDRQGGSYYLKHVIQRGSKAYICNGAVIMAAERLGFIIKPQHGFSRNAWFNIGKLLLGMRETDWQFSSNLRHLYHARPTGTTWNKKYTERRVI